MKIQHFAQRYVGECQIFDI